MAATAADAGGARTKPAVAGVVQHLTWNIWTQFLGDTTSALKLDSLAESHPIEVEIHHAREADEIFDAISYEKGASIIRMLQNYLGAEHFQKALATYMRKYAFSNAETDDLWAVLEEKSGERIENLMSTWTKQQGYPVIDAKLNGNHLELEQAQFLLNGSSGSGMWLIPITLGCSSYDAQEKFIMKGKGYKLDIKDIAPQCGNQKKSGKFWIKLNINQTGFYRVKYDDELAVALQNALLTDKLSIMDKIGIVEDFPFFIYGMQANSNIFATLTVCLSQGDRLQRCFAHRHCKFKCC